LQSVVDPVPTTIPEKPGPRPSGMKAFKMKRRRTTKSPMKKLKKDSFSLKSPGVFEKKDNLPGKLFIKRYKQHSRASQQKHVAKIAERQHRISMKSLLEQEQHSQMYHAVSPKIVSSRGQVRAQKREGLFSADGRRPSPRIDSISMLSD